MDADSNSKVAVRRTPDGDYRWELVQRCTVFRRVVLEASEHQFLTREGAYSEGSKALSGWIGERSGPRAERHLRLVHGLDGPPAASICRDSLLPTRGIFLFDVADVDADVDSPGYFVNEFGAARRKTLDALRRNIAP